MIPQAMNEEQARVILTRLRARQAAMVGLLEKFVRAESPTDAKASVDRFGRLVAAEWRRRRARVGVVSQAHAGDHLRIVWSPAGATARPLLVLGHLDTVYSAGTLPTMPFRVSRGRAFGPGAFDMKGGLVMALFAVDALAQIKVQSRRPVIFLWTSDEETGSETSRALIEREARRSEAVLVLEPAGGPDGRLKTQRKGVGTAELRITGRAAHAGLDPQSGINAV